MDRAGALVNAQVDALILDSAHGHSANILKAVEQVKNAFPQISLIAGNVATAEGTEALIKASGRCRCGKGGYRPRLYLHHPCGCRYRCAPDHSNL